MRSPLFSLVPPLVMTGIIALFMSACQTLPPRQDAWYFDSLLQASSIYSLSKIELHSLSSIETQKELNGDLAIQAARRHGIKLIASTGAEVPEFQVTIRINEQAYDHEVERVQSIACVLKISRIVDGENQLVAQFLSTEDSSLSLASAGYVFGLLEHLFSQMAGTMRKSSSGS